MTIFYDRENNLLIKAEKTKASKYLKNNFEDLNLVRIIDNVSANYKPVFIDLSIFGVETIITATKYEKDYLNNEV